MMQAAKAYVCLALLCLPLGACLALSSAGADRVGLDYSDEKTGLEAIYGPEHLLDGEP